MNILRAKWLSSMENAKELYDKGASIFVCDYALDEVKDDYELMKEAEIKEKKAKKEAAAKLTFEEVGAKIGRLVSEKNVKYGDSFNKSGNILQILFPDGIKPSQYDDVLTITRIVDKLFRVATDNDAFGESPWRDIAGYAILKVAALDNENL